MVALSYFRGMMKWLTVFFILAVSVTAAHAQKVYDFNTTCEQAYQEITKLKMGSGMALIEKARQQNPDNLIPLLLESYVDFFVLLFNEDPKDLQTRYPRFAEILEQLQEGPKNSPFYNYCLTTVRIHRVAAAIKFGKLWDAGWDFRKAFQLIKENKKIFPEFTPNELTYGCLQAVAGTIPKGYKWIAGLLGIKGSVTEGMNSVRTFINSNDAWSKLYFNEAAFIYPYLMFYIENKKTEALAFTQQKKLDLVNNHLHAYMTANLAINNQQSEYAKNIILNRSPSAEYLRTGIWDFELGFTKLNHLETEEAARYFENFVGSFKGRFYLKDAYQKLSWCYYLQGNMARAEEARKNILKKGATDSDADKKALKDAKSGQWPNVLLLKARLLNDGGYHNEAAALLHGKTEDDFSKEEEKLEFSYRVARIYDDLGRTDEAIHTYLIAIRLGQSRREYYAARAALQIGQIYERRGQKTVAISYYQKCLDMDDHDYKDSLDQRAKSGIARCKGE